MVGIVVGILFSVVDMVVYWFDVNANLRREVWPVFLVQIEKRHVAVLMV